MFTKSFIVVSVSRTGSQLVVRNLRNHFKCWPISTHNPLIECADDQTVVISKRKNDFDTMLSMTIGTRTNEFVYYTDKPVDSFTISQEDFETLFWHVQCHQRVIQDRFASSVIVEFEPMINDSKYLFRQFGIDKETNYCCSKKSPYDAQKLVQNYAECKSWFDQLSKRSLTQSIIDTFISVQKIHSDKHVVNTK